MPKILAKTMPKNVIFAKYKTTNFTMKRILFALIIACGTAFAAYAQKDIPAGQRYEAVQLDDNDDVFSVFKYKDADGTFGYYLSVGHTTSRFDIEVGSILDGSFRKTPETCICLGANADEALKMLNGLIELLDEEVGTVKELPCRNTNGVGLLDYSTASCEIVKPFLCGKRFRIAFKCNDHLYESDLTKGNLKSLRNGLKLNQKLQPDK